MIKLSFLALFSALCTYSCSQRQQTATNTRVPVKVDTVVVDQTTKDNKESQLDFAVDIQPILQSHCVPCHFSGGKMYARMPFDDPQTLHDHSEGILRRITDEEEAKKIKDFLTEKQE